MSRIGKTFARRSLTAPLVNREAWPTWPRPLEEQYLQALVTNTMGQTFYAAEEELVTAGTLHDAMLARDADFAARAIVHARTRGFLRAQPLYGLAKLATLPAPLFEQSFAEVVRTPRDLADFAALVKALRGGEGGRRIKRVAAAWLNQRVDEYWAIKYGAAQTSGYSLRDLYRVYHPRAGEPRPLVAHILGNPADLAALPQLRAFARLKAARDDAAKIAAISEGRLPHEVVTPFATSRAVWLALVPELPLLALIRHLRALERHGALDEARPLIEARLRTPGAIARAKILPFRLLAAAQALSTRWAQEALGEALEQAFANVPTLGGRTAVLLDRSGSMEDYLATASLLAVSLVKRSPDARLLTFDDRVEEPPIARSESILSQARTISARGGTDTARPLRQLVAEHDRVDQIVLISDEQQNLGAPFLDVLDEYRRKVNPAVKTFIIDVAPYRSGVVPVEPNTFYVYGWSDQALGFVAMAAAGFGGMVEAVRAGIN
jgi:60 kDa SS-A/Ro ribonucleoprotein